MENAITLTIVHGDEEKILEVPNDLGLNLMEFLNANDYEQIEGTCGGIALCATCHVRVLECSPSQDEKSDDEYAILETLPVIYDNSRLSCQIKLNTNLKNIKILIPES